jgi:phosphopantothenoylcysteine decarboxylase/phosphopantothenate--cysteine ligase
MKMENTRRSSPTGDRPAVLLGVTGGIAAYKVPQIARLLSAEADVRVVMTQAARRFVTPLTFQAVSGRPVLTDMFEAGDAGAVAHVTEAERADLVVVAPATADFIARAAAGRADDLLGAMLLVTRAPVVIAPAMNTRMWEHPATRRNLSLLKGFGRIHQVGPLEGDLACGWSGPGRMAEPDDIARFALGLLKRDGILRGRRVLVTSGPTEEPLDPVRVVTNRSSGRMGHAIAAEAAAEGASVTLVRGPVYVDDPPGVKVIPVRTTDQMHAAVSERLDDMDVVFMAAAVADYRPRDVSRGKLRKEEAGDTLKMHFVRTRDILADCASRRTGDRPLLVGFSLETDASLAVDAARHKIKTKGCDLVVSNVASENLGTGEGKVTLVAPRSRPIEVGPASKPELARHIIAWAATKLSR